MPPQESSIDDGIALRPRLLKQQKTEVDTPPASPKIGLYSPRHSGGLGILKNGGVPRFCTSETFDMPSADGKYNDKEVEPGSPRITGL